MLLTKKQDWLNMSISLRNANAKISRPCASKCRAFFMPDKMRTDLCANVTEVIELSFSG